MVVRKQSSAKETWLRETRDLDADYRLMFGGEPDAVLAIGFMIDTDQTGARAASLLGPVERLTLPPVER